MWFRKSYLLFVLLIVFCVYSLSECKELNRKKSNSTEKLKKRNSSVEKLVIRPKTTKSSLLTTNSKPSKSTRIPKAIKKSILSSKQKVSKNNVLRSAKLQTTSVKPTINFANGISGDQRERAVEIVKEVIESNNKSKDLGECIRKELERELGIRSNVILSSTPFIDQSLSKISGTVVMQMSVSMGNGRKKTDVLVSVFGLMKGNEFIEQSNNLMKTAQKLSPKIIDSLMSTEMKQEIQKLSTRVVRNAKSMVELSDQLSEVLNDRFGPHWHAVVGHKNMMFVDNHRKSSVFFLDMDFGDMRVAVFK